MAQSKDSALGAEGLQVQFAFSGGAWLHAFYFGVGAAIADLSTDRGDERVRFSGVSAGGLVAAGLAAQMDMRVLWEHAVGSFPRAGRNPFKACQATNETIETQAPADDVWQKISKQRRLMIGVSEKRSCGCFSGMRVMLFENRSKGMAALRASCHLPLLGGCRGSLVEDKRCYDGQLTQGRTRLPIFDDIDEKKDCVVRITAYHDKNHAKLQTGWISPQVDLPRRWLLFPDSENVLQLIWRLGYSRAVEYIYESDDAPRLQTYFVEATAQKLQQNHEDVRHVLHQLKLASDARSCSCLPF